MNNNFIQSKIWYVALGLLFINPLTAKVNPQPGENLWRLMARVGDGVDIADSKLDLLDSQQDLICSKIEKVDDDLATQLKLVESVLEVVESVVDEVDDSLATHNDIVCSKLEIVESVVDKIDENVIVVCSKIEKVDDDLATHNDIVCSKLENVTSLVENVDDGVTALCSKIEKVDDDLATHNEVVCSKLEDITSKIDELEFAGPCEILIFQSDIPFTADKPGVYCLAESVTFAAGTAITIAADNVLLDLNEKKIDGSAGGDIGIAINSGLSNITIQNGVLCNMNNKGIDADATNNIAFISMSVLDSLVDMPARVAPITCLQIKDIKVLNVGIFKVFPIISIVDSIIDSIIDIPDCVLSSITGININCVTEVVLNNCQALYCLGDGFALQMVDNGTIESCSAIKNGGNGFVLDNTDTTCFKWCKANMNCFHGVCDSACNGDNVYLGCIAKQNGIHGFNIAGGGKVLQECIASQNTRDGFNLSTSLLFDADLDANFGTGGKVTTDLGGSDFGNAVALQKDGKIVVAGQSTVGGGSFNFAVARYNTDGSLDVTFNPAGSFPGTVTTNFGGSLDIGRAVAIQKDGKIVVAGISNAEVGTDFAVARYNTDGSLDITFNPTGSLPGTVTTNFGGSDFGNAVALQKDGKIVVAGQSTVGGGSFNFAVARYNTDGSLDATFNPTGSPPGTVTTDFGGTDIGRAVAIQKDGKIVVAGRSNTGETNDFAVARYNTDGSLDVTFNSTGSLPGTVTTDFGGDDRGEAVAIQKDGKIVAAGRGGPSTDFAVARYNTDGSLDSTFNPTGSLPGTVTTDFGGNDFGFAIAMQKDGKIVVAGESNGGDDDFAVARYNTDGSLDVTFNPTGSLPGTVTTDFSGNNQDQGLAVVIQKDGKIVVAGQSDAGGNDNFAVARYVVFKRGVAVRDCIAEENGEDGFNIAGSAYEVSNSSAIHNAFNGFLLESLTDDCQLLSNKALKNGNIGLENLGTDNQILNNRSHKNVNSNYAGVALVAIPTATTGFWENVEA